MLITVQNSDQNNQVAHCLYLGHVLADFHQLEALEYVLTSQRQSQCSQ
jgi:hypothetical protein